jgi:hypothetical protein
MEEEGIKPYIEESKTDNTPLLKEDKFSKFDSWLNG